MCTHMRVHTHTHAHLHVCKSANTHDVVESSWPFISIAYSSYQTARFHLFNHSQFLFAHTASPIKQSPLCKLTNLEPSEKYYHTVSLLFSLNYFTQEMSPIPFLLDYMPELPIFKAENIPLHLHNTFLLMYLWINKNLLIDNNSIICMSIPNSSRCGVSYLW